MYPPGYFDLETLLTATWTPDDGVTVTSSVLPPTWHRALARLGRDLRFRHYNGSIEHIRFEANHRPNRDDDVEDWIWLSSEVTPLGGTPNGMMHDGDGILGDAHEDTIAVGCAYFVQDQIARAGIVWPRRTGECLSASVVDGTALWIGKQEQVRIGTLTA